jgi:hypothetical protein
MALASAAVRNKTQAINIRVAATASHAYLQAGSL